jgi:hypothetical protein
VIGNIHHVAQQPHGKAHEKGVLLGEDPMIQVLMTNSDVSAGFSDYFSSF